MILWMFFAALYVIAWVVVLRYEWYSQFLRGAAYAVLAIGSTVVFLFLIKEL